MFCFFFFSSRRRHTRSLCDWSSDVCSSDLRRGRQSQEEQQERQEQPADERHEIRKSTRLNSSHTVISYAVFCLKKKKIMSADSGFAISADKTEHCTLM